MYMWDIRDICEGCNYFDGAKSFLSRFARNHHKPQTSRKREALTRSTNTNLFISHWASFHVIISNLLVIQTLHLAGTSLWPCTSFGYLSPRWVFITLEIACIFLREGVLAQIGVTSSFYVHLAYALQKRYIHYCTPLRSTWLTYYPFSTT